MTLVKFYRPTQYSSPYRGLQANRSRPEIDWTPRIDVFEQEKEYSIYAELPGLDKQDIELTYTENVLTLKGKKKNEYDDDTNGRLLHERVFGKFERNFRFAEQIDDAKISAEFRNGILTVAVPKTPEAQPAKVTIK